MISLRYKLICRSFSGRRKLTGMRDITGSGISTRSEKYVEFIDDYVMRSITQVDLHYEKDSLLKAIKLEPECGFAYALTAFDILKNARSTQHEETFWSCMKTLNKLLVEGKLTSRDKYYAAAALSMKMGNFTNAGYLLESVLTDNPHDILAIKMAQEAYIAIGDKKNAMACVTRGESIADSDHFLHGHFLGFLATGFLEAGNFQQAEDFAQRSVEVTRGKDLTALSALFSVNMLTGRSTEVKGLTEKYSLMYDKTVSGLATLRYFKGLSLADRGNNQSATREIVDMITGVEEQYSLGLGINLATLTNITVLAWKISLSLSLVGGQERWYKIAELWSKTEGSGCLVTPLSETCKSIAFVCAGTKHGGLPLSFFAESTMYASSTRQRSAKDNLFTEEHELHAEEYTGGHSQDPTTNTPAASAHVTLFSKVRSVVQALALNPKTEEENATTRETLVNTGKLKVIRQEPLALDSLLSDHLEKLLHTSLKGDLNGYGGESDSALSAESDILKDCRHLLNVKPKFSYSWAIPEMADGGTQLTFSINSLVYPFSSEILPALCKANPVPVVESVEGEGEMDAGDEDAARWLAIVQQLDRIRPAFGRLGGTSIQQDILEVTFIESLMRGKRWREAKGLLLERTVLDPNEGQSWRRLAVLYHYIGEEDLGNSARYTAWQLGFGQGGYGGTA